MFMDTVMVMEKVTAIAISVTVCGHTKTDFFAHSENVLPCVKVVRCCRIKAVP